MDLITDACALRHARDARDDSGSPLDVLIKLAEAGLRFRTARGVRTELATPMGMVIERWEELEWFCVEGVSLRSTERREVAKALASMKRKRPGKKDVDLVALAKRHGAPLLTHDAGAARLAGLCKVVVVDLLDVADLACTRGVLDWTEIEPLYARLGASAQWRPSDWAGSVQSTVEARPHRQRTQVSIAELLPEPEGGS